MNLIGLFVPDKVRPWRTHVSKSPLFDWSISTAPLTMFSKFEVIQVCCQVEANYGQDESLEPWSFLRSRARNLMPRAIFLRGSRT